jgi:hypothetical protein
MSESFKYEGFLAIAKELGHHVESISHDGSDEDFTKAYDRAGSIIKDCSAFFLPNHRILSCKIANHPAHPTQLHKRVKCGARVLVTPYFDQLDKWNGFLAPYDLTVSTIRIHKSIFNKPGYNFHEPVIKRSAHTFRDARLFQGVDEVVLQSPVAIWYGGESLPILCATENEMPVDGTTDLLPNPEGKVDPSTGLPEDWNARKLACMAIWYGESDGAVLASAGPGFSDPFIESNKGLAANLIRFLCDNVNPTLSAEQHYSRIEVNLADFVFGIVKATGEDWWSEHIPLPIRQKCAQRQEEEKCQWPKEAYLDLVDLKEIMEKQWKLFESYIAAEGYKGGKEKSLAWLDRLNKLRRMFAHQLKKHVAGYEFSQDDEAFLSECDSLVLRLLRRSKTE